MGSSDYFEKIKKEKGNKKCLQSFASFRGFRGGSCLMFILQHADSSGNGTNGSSFASWSILADHKQGLFKQLTLFPPFFHSGEDVFFAFSTFLSVLVRSRWKVFNCFPRLSKRTNK